MSFHESLVLTEIQFPFLFVQVRDFWQFRASGAFSSGVNALSSVHTFDCWSTCREMRSEGNPTRTHSVQLRLPAGVRRHAHHPRGDDAGPDPDVVPGLL